MRSQKLKLEILKIMHKKNSHLYKYLGYFFLVIVLTAFDQFTKLLAVDKLKNQAPFVIWDGVFEFSYVENRGAAFGMQQGMIALFVVITLIIVPLMIFIIHKIDKLIYVMGTKVNKKAFVFLQIVFVILIAGAIGNLIDRLALGYVVDFLYFKLIDFPVFNVADCYVTVSTIALILIGFFMLSEKELDYLLYSQKKWSVDIASSDEDVKNETSIGSDEKVEEDTDNED